eukprot:1925419-Prymnesium_polylepis.2
MKLNHVRGQSQQGQKRTELMPCHINNKGFKSLTERVEVCTRESGALQKAIKQQPLNEEEPQLECTESSCVHLTKSPDPDAVFAITQKQSCHGHKIVVCIANRTQKARQCRIKACAPCFTRANLSAVGKNNKNACTVYPTKGRACQSIWLPQSVLCTQTWSRCQPPR